MTQLVQRAESDWLSVRRPADERARELAIPLLGQLDDHFRAKLGTVAPDLGAGQVSVYDLGAGSGANLAWLGPRLNFPQQWTLIDLDRELLYLAPGAGAVPQVTAVHKLVASIDALEAILAGCAGPTLVTCSAVLDVLSLEQLKSLCTVIAKKQLALLFSLNVTGVVQMSPAHRLDADLEAAFNSHQLRSGLAGPQAVSLTERYLRQAGFDVHVESTPWILGPDDSALIRRYLSERVSAATEQDPTLTQSSRVWLAERLNQLRNGVLEVRVGHRDLLAFPPS